VQIPLNKKLRKKLGLEGFKKKCCVENDTKNCCQYISYYHFFRNVIVATGTKIDVKVCGLKNFIVQNDESLQDVNGPVYPFGTRPDIVDFNVINGFKKYCITSEFIKDAQNAMINNVTENILKSL